MGTGAFVNVTSLSRTALQLQLAWLRLPILHTAVVGVLLSVASVWLLLLPRLQGHVVLQQAEIERTARLLAATPAKPTGARNGANEQRLQAFRGMLADPRYAEQHVKTLFALATRNGLALNQADYALGNEAHGQFRTYRVVLPVKGEYPAIRRFCEQVLESMAFASIDELTFRKDTAASAALETRFVLTLYLGRDNAPKIEASAGEPE